MPRIDKRLNFVIPIYRDDDPQSKDIKAYVHSTPISAETFDQFYKPLARVHTQIFGGGYAATSGPRIADKLLRDTAKEMGIWEGEEGVQRALMGEIRRLTNVMCRAPDGQWQSLMLADAVRTGVIDKDELGEVEPPIVFFIVCSAIMHRRDSTSMLALAASLWNAHIEPLNATDFRSSLSTSTEKETSAQSVPAG